MWKQLTRGAMLCTLASTLIYGCNPKPSKQKAAQWYVDEVLQVGESYHRAKRTTLKLDTSKVIVVRGIATKTETTYEDRQQLSRLTGELLQTSLRRQKLVLKGFEAITPPPHLERLHTAIIQVPKSNIKGLHAGIEALSRDDLAAYVKTRDQLESQSKQNLKELVRHADEAGIPLQRLKTALQAMDEQEQGQ